MSSFPTATPSFHPTQNQNLSDQPDDSANYLRSLPSGYRFCPTDDELVHHYLLKKVKNKKLPKNQIQEIELYKHDPDYLSKRYPCIGDHNEWYFFTSRARKYQNGKRPNRTINKNGFWKASSGDQKVKRNGQIIGYRKTLVFYHRKDKKTNWIMQEYTLKEDSTIHPTSSAPTDHRKLDDYVLCKIYRHPYKSKEEVHNTKSRQGKDVAIQIVENGDGHEGYENSIPADALFPPESFNNTLAIYKESINLPDVNECNNSLQYNHAPLPSESHLQNNLAPLPSASNLQYNFAPLPSESHLQYNLAPLPSASHFQYNFAPLPSESHLQYNLALLPLESHIQYNPASHLQYNLAPLPSESHLQYNLAPLPSESHLQYNPAPLPSESYPQDILAPLPLKSYPQCAECFTDEEKAYIASVLFR